MGRGSVDSVSERLATLVRVEGVTPPDHTFPTHCMCASRDSWEPGGGKGEREVILNGCDRCHQLETGGFPLPLASTSPEFPVTVAFLSPVGFITPRICLLMVGMSCSRIALSLGS